ncbi:MAG TPA: twin-arginine translocation signal domain-containing protein [Gemmatimonadaceae bacterium]|nr:twin-arginine translocation signal domain-containing protein [Gemmatimonadaceae bacterium]
MSIDRRDFVGRLAAGALLAGVPLPIDASVRALSETRPELAEEWDVSWVNRITGKYRAIFDVPEIDSGYGVWRASIWARQYQEVLGAKPNELSAVVVLRHNGIQLAMQQAYWDKYGIGKEKKVLHPITQQETDRNPVLLASSRGEVPAMFDDAALDRFISRGGIALACNLALQDVIESIQKKENVSAEEARKQAIAFMVPGVILQPSGVFAALHAQDAGCKYLRSS